MNLQFKILVILICQIIIVFLWTSSKYNVDNKVKTYAWIKDTAISKITNTTKADSPIQEKLILVKEIVDLNKHNNKWPAVILAINRTLRVSGRIIFLIASIKTINLISATGVPLGTKWASA